ncbi:hypothetical protein HS1genome_1916 [Sulfodiicoccus acidiphilus]|uniref:Uncharacterized protein n=1 Tax=Sulfodiicoccus acidiphilus TaxID=1670455 RepID=A0A348B5S5_9CREN|nr:hypothetical protein HS1genome_1916 [Sulfodiicoccus acidiphilus]GGT92522.1 hypothetical protein GCM10007116_07840 [Sulfodiicoccus acidiphilus]
MNMLINVGLVVKQGSYIRKGRLDYKPELLHLELRKRCSVSERGDRALSVRHVAVSLSDGLSERLVESARFHAKDGAKVVRPTAIRRFDPTDPARKGGAKWEVRERGPKLVRLAAVFEPPLKVGEVVSYGLNTWDMGYFPLTVRELRERYNMDSSMEGIAVGQPALHVELEVQFPWRPRDLRAVRAAVVTNSGPHEFEPIKCEHRLVEGERSATLETWNPPRGMYFVAWRPPDD